MLIVRFSVDKFLFQGEKFQMFYLKTFVNFLIVGITILVVAVPEGLPLAVTLSLAYSVKVSLETKRYESQSLNCLLFQYVPTFLCQQMMKDNNLVRHLDACETMGNATTICSDKTGTLTANKMTAVQCFICGTYYRNLSKRYIELPAEVQTIVSQNIALNSQFTSRLVKDENNTIKQFGNKTECALLGFLFKVRADFRQIRDNFLQSDMHRIYPFNSTRKLMRTVIRLPQDRGFRILAKGASEIILKRCKYILGAKGEILLLPATETDKVINEVIKKMAEDGLRTIMLAYIDYIYPSSMMYSNCRVIARNKPEPDWDSEESYVDMTCLGVVGIEDPVRKDVRFLGHCLGVLILIVCRFFLAGTRGNKEMSESGHHRTNDHR